MVRRVVQFALTLLGLFGQLALPAASPQSPPRYDWLQFGGECRAQQQQPARTGDYAPQPAAHAPALPSGVAGDVGRSSGVSAPRSYAAGRSRPGVSKHHRGGHHGAGRTDWSDNLVAPLAQCSLFEHG